VAGLRNGKELHMQTIAVVSALLGLAVMAGCQSAGTQGGAAVRPAPKVMVATPTVSAVGQPVQEVIAAAKSRRMEFFTLDGKALESLPDQAAGSVSIHAADGAGQDNYRFDATGRINRHMRSSGANYAAGIWKTLP
jgi:hypothetical protein